MNDDALHMIDMIRPKKNVGSATKIEHEIVADRSLENSKKMISTMQYEIEKLQ